MNNDISIRPAYLDRLAPPEAFADTIGFVSPARISMNNDRFNPIDENGAPALPPSLALQVIMLWENDTREYRSKNADGSSTYDPDNPLPPDCYSDNRITPSEGAVQPQHATCAGCPRATRDQPSFKGTTLVALCRDQYKVACLVAGAKGKVFLLKIGPASRKAYAQYRNFLKQHHAAPDQVITTLGYADKSFIFSFGSWVSPQTAEMVKKIAETDEPAMTVNAYDRPRQAALPGPSKDQTYTKQMVQNDPEPARTFDEPPRPPEMGEGPVETPKRRGRPPKDAPTGAPTPVAFAAAPTPPRSVPAQQAKMNPVNLIPAQQVKTNPVNQFGMEQGQKPPVDIQEALNRAFGP